MKPNENAPAVTPRSHPNSSRIGGKEQRESRARVDAHGHRHEDDADDDPSIEERQSPASFSIKGPS
jgi:hypothetical protein